MMSKLNIVVIGAGVAGLCAAKYAIQSGHSVTVYEQTAEVGGTWVYTDATGTDEYGIDIHTSMYHGLRTNLPKEIMNFPDFPMPTSLCNSYIESEKVHNYLEAYARQFNVVDKIKFRHYVIRVRPVQETKWELIVRDLPRDKVKTHIYDAIFVGVGNNSAPNWPQPPLPGFRIFRGKQSHSHDYRRAEAFEGKNVLIVGAGPSGIDLAALISRSAKCVYFSHHTHDSALTFPANVARVGATKELTETGVILADGTQHDVDEIVYCTGYMFAYPFLSADCGLCLDKKYIQPLFKHTINLNYPTMAIIGIPFTAVVAQLVDIQARFVMKFWNGEKSLPSMVEMKADSERYAEARRLAGTSRRQANALDGFLKMSQNYYDELSALADIENVRKIYLKIYKDCRLRRAASPNGYRSDRYRIIDDEHFQRTTIA